ncbi:MAG: hypothetical protein RL021_1985 [Bacteroidota bacterium]|jgi:hypothetical protein
MRKNIASKLSKGITGIAGEYFVAGELSRRGYMASITLRNNESIDIHASSLVDKKIFAIQVKTSQYSSRKWPVGQKAENLQHENMFYVFVAFNKIDERPSYFIVPSKEVAKHVKAGHQKWLATPGKKGQAHKDTAMRQFSDKSGKYLERWDLLR